MILDKEFNLLKEPWIRVLTFKGEEELYSLTEVFKRASEIKEISGELPTQDIAILRLLLAILHAAFGKQDDGLYPSLDDGRSEDLDEFELLERWKEIWDRGTFPERLYSYLQEYEDRFWLFHPDRPFFQVPEMPVATSYDSAKLNGELSESANKIRLFPSRTGEAKLKLSYAEAARWLIHLNAFDDTSAKPRGTREGKLPSPGAGWLGRLGLIFAEDDTLFETLLLNWVLWDDNGQAWGIENPTWKSDKARTEERVYISIPDNQSELLTLQSRRLLLEKEDSVVRGYLLLGGDILDPEAEIIVEQMTLWRTKDKNKIKAGERINTPRRHNPERQLWRDMDAILISKEGDGVKNRRPGLLTWLGVLAVEEVLDNSPLLLRTASIQYGDKDFFAADVFQDKLVFSKKLIKKEASKKRELVFSLISWTDELVRKLGFLARRINLAEGGDNNSAAAAASGARRRAYYILDVPFRRWLARYEPDKEEERAANLRWKEEATRLIRDEGAAIVRRASTKAIKGRIIDDKVYSSAQAFNSFLAAIHS